MKLDEMNKDQRSLLLFLETCCVDGLGAVKIAHMNAEDISIANEWTKVGFVKFGRIASECLPMPSGSTHWCWLSDDAWELAHKERRARYDRNISARIWRSTEEKRKEGTP